MSLLIKGGITKLSELTIDANKDWAAKLIKNLGAPVDPNDAARLADVGAVAYGQGARAFRSFNVDVPHFYNYGYHVCEFDTEYEDTDSIFDPTVTTVAENQQSNMTDGTFYGVYWDGQTFTPAANCKINKVRLKLFKVGAPSTSLTVSIRATSGGKPTGGDLATGGIDDISWLLTNNAGEWITLELNTELDLVGGTMYAIVVRSPSSGSGTSPAWRYQNTDVYAGGTFVQSGDSGNTWLIQSGWDFAFKVIYTNNTKLVCKHAGVYYVCCNLNYLAYNVGDRQLYIMKNCVPGPQGFNVRSGGYNIAEDTKVNAGAAASVTLGRSTRIYLAVNNWVELMTMCTPGAGNRLTVRALPQYCPVLGMQRIG